jgi:hypothetical protein
VGHGHVLAPDILGLGSRVVPPGGGSAVVIGVGIAAEPSVTGTLRDDAIGIGTDNG